MFSTAVTRSKGKHNVDEELLDPPKTLTHKYENEILMAYIVSTKVNASGDVIGVQMYPYNYTCKTIRVLQV